MNTHDDVVATTTQALDAVHRITDRMLEPETARAMLLGTAAVMIARNLGEDELNAEAVKRVWQEQGLRVADGPGAVTVFCRVVPGTAGGGGDRHPQGGFWALISGR